jgi:hypothetical protein
MGICIRQVFFWGVIAQIITGRRKLRGGNMHRIRRLGLLVLPEIKVYLLLFLLLPLALLGWLVRQDSAFADGANQLHDLLGLILGREEAPLGFGGAAEGCAQLAARLR